MTTLRASSSGGNPTEADMKEIIKSVDASGSGTVELPDLMNLMGTKFKELDDAEKVAKAFKVLRTHSNRKLRDS